jgi:signal transduction histidine kinase
MTFDHDERAQAIPPLGDPEVAPYGSLEQYMEHVPVAFAVTHGREHTLVYTNAAFRVLAAASDAPLGAPLADSLLGQRAPVLIKTLDRAIRTGVVARDQRIEPLGNGEPAWCCSVWPGLRRDGEPEHLVIELRPASKAEMTLALQREVAERMLLSALEERDLAVSAEASRRRATFLATESRRLGGSLNEDATRAAVTRLTLPDQSDWCIVDIVDATDATHRLAIVHPHPGKQAVLAELARRWSPEPGDPFGAPAVLEHAGAVVVLEDDVDAAVALAAHDAETLRVLRDVGVGSLLTVPLITGAQIIGAVTFVAEPKGRAFSPDDVALAEDLAARSAMALDNARMHSETIAHQAKAEAASQAKSAFLGTMSHELRTPLNAIGGYVDLIDLGLRGPVTEEQHTDLARIRNSQRHLVSLITDVLNFVRVGAGRVQYSMTDVPVHEVLVRSISLIEPLLSSKGLTYGGVVCDGSIVARADEEKVTQVVVNLLSNAIKFTATGGRGDIGCNTLGDAVHISVADTGVGIAADKLETIFEPFVQVRGGLAGRDTGVGLGLAISRDLARGMGGDLLAQSEPGAGSTFTLVLPRVMPEHVTPHAGAR